MASKNLPTNLTGGETGHPALHNDIHEVVNEFDYDAIAGAANGQVIKRSGGIWTAGTDNDSAAGGGAEIGRRFVDPQQSDNTGDGHTPATAKRDIQAAINSLPAGGGQVILAAHANHNVGSSVEDNGKPVDITGLHKTATEVFATASFGPVFHLTGDSSGVRNMHIRTNDGNRIGSGAVLLQEKHQYAEHLYIRGFGQSVNSPFEAEDPDAPYGIKSMSPSTTEATYPSFSDTKLADWLYINDIDFFEVYRGIVMLAGCNGQIFNLRRRAAHRGALYFERGGSLLNTSFEVGQSHIVSDTSDHPSGTRDSGYLVYMRHISTQVFMWMRFSGMRTESFNANGPAHYFCDVASVSWDSWTAHGSGGQQRLIDFGTDGNSDRNVVAPPNTTPALWNTYQNASNVRFLSTNQSGGH